ncbi:hypothetical protein ACOMHN_045442 [Nucella lapillus]
MTSQDKGVQPYIRQQHRTTVFILTSDNTIGQRCSSLQVENITGQRCSSLQVENITGQRCSSLHQTTTQDKGVQPYRVLQPPGGGSSNIFGDAPARSAPAAAAAANRPSNKPTDAGIFGATGQSAQGGAQRTARDGDDSFNRLFGDSAASPAHSQKGASASQRVSTHSILFGNARDRQSGWALTISHFCVVFHVTLTLS